MYSRTDIYLFYFLCYLLTLTMSNARDFCNAAQAAKTNQVAGIIDSINPITAIGRCFKSDAEAQSSIKKNIENKVSTTTRTLLTQDCSNASAITQSNIVDNTACMTQLCDYSKLAKDLSGLGFSSADIQQMIAAQRDLCKSFTSGNIIQRNKLDAKQTCTVNNLIKILQESSLDANLMALYRTSLESKGMMSGVKSTANDCTNVNNNISSEQYTDAFQKCAAALKMTQSNVGDCIASANQENVANLFADCMQSQGVQSDHKTSTTTAANTSTDTQAKAEGLTSAALVFIMLGAIVLIGAAGGVYYKFVLKKGI